VQLVKGCWEPASSDSQEARLRLGVNWPLKVKGTPYEHGPIISAAERKSFCYGLMVRPL